jgi:hypothetical protein
MSRKPWVFGWILAPVFAGLAFLAADHGVAWFLLFWVLAMTWVILAWVVILPRWQRARPLARRFARASAGPADAEATALWQGIGAIRFPVELGGLNASWPLARVVASANGVHLGPTATWMRFIPSLSLEWADLERIEAVGHRGVRLRIKEPNTAVLVFALGNRSGLMDLAEQHGVAVDRSRRRHPWLNVG